MTTDPAPKELTREDRVTLSILEEVEKNPETSQRSLAKNLGIALGLVNSLVKRVALKGYVKVKRLNQKNIKYILTPKGFYEKSRLSYRFLRHSIHYLWLYRQRSRELLAPFAEDGINEVVIFGSGEEAELVFLTIQDLSLKLVAILDPEKAGKQLLGYEIQDFTWLNDIEDIEVLIVLQSSSTRDGFLQNLNDIHSRTMIKNCVHISL